MLGATRDQAFLRTFGSPPPTIRPDAGEGSHIASPIASGWAARLNALNRYIPISAYIGMNEEIAKGYVVHPTNQGQRAAIAQRQSMMYDPRNSPSRSQKAEGYTSPAQNFAAYNTWNTPAGLSSKGKRNKQPSLRTVSPFSRLPIPTRMPWDV